MLKFAIFMLEFTTFITILFSLTILTIIIVNAIYSLVVWKDLSEMYWKEIRNISIVCSMFIVGCFVFYATFAITALIF